MLCGTGCTSKRPRSEDEYISVDDHQLMENRHIREREALERELARMTKETKDVGDRLEQLEKVVKEQAEMLYDRQSFAEKVTYLDNKYAKGIDDITSVQKECARNIADLLKLVAACTKYFNTRYVDLPDDVKRECERLEKQIRHDWFNYAICLGIPNSVIEERRGSNDIESFWNVIQFRHSIEPLKVQDLQMAFVKVKRPGLEEDRQMPTVHIEVVNYFKKELYTEVIDAVVVLPYMRCLIYITPEVLQHTILPDATITRMANLIDVLPTFGCKGLPVLADGLYHSGHEKLSSKLREMAKQKGAPIGDPSPIPLDEKDRLCLRRKSRLLESQRITEEINEIRQMLLEKTYQQISERREETTRFQHY